MRKCNHCKVEKPLEEFAKDKSRSKGRAYRCKPCMKEVYMERYYEDSLVKRRGKYNDYYNKRFANLTEEQLENKREYERKWSKSNPDKVKEYTKRTYEKNPSIKIGHNVRTRMYQVLKGISKHEPTLKLLGCSIKDYKLYLESKFDENMSWDNYGTYWEIDHIKELYKFDLTQYTQQMEAFNFTNTQPLEITENRKKR